MGSLVGVSVTMARKHFDSEGMSLMQGRAIASDPMQSVPNLDGGSSCISIAGALPSIMRASWTELGPLSSSKGGRKGIY